MRYKILAAIAVAIAPLAGCATVTRGTNVAFEVETIPAGARVTTNSGFTCEATPCRIRMPRKDSFIVTITHPGYHTVTVPVTARMSSGGGAGLAGNILIGGLIGVGVDAASGALNDLFPNPLRVTLTPLSEPAPPPVTQTPAPAPAPRPGS